MAAPPLNSFLLQRRDAFCAGIFEDKRRKLTMMSSVRGIVYYAKLGRLQTEDELHN